MKNYNIQRKEQVETYHLHPVQVVIMCAACPVGYYFHQELSPKALIGMISVENWSRSSWVTTSAVRTRVLWLEKDLTKMWQ